MTTDQTTLPLRDIHLPAVVSWWPLATGWWIALAVLVVASAAAGWLWLRHRRYRTRREALAGLSRAEAHYAANHDAHALARSLSQLLRQVALIYGGSGAAAATDARWLAVLGELAGEPWPETTARVLLVAPYSARAAELIEHPTYLSATALARRCFERLPARPARVSV